MASGEPRISPWSLPDLKNTSDDALGNYLRGLKFEQDHSKLDVRLAIGYASVVIAAATFVADYKLGWEVTKLPTAFAVAAYAILSAALQYWTWAVEKGIVFEGTRNGQKISISTKSIKHDPTYYLTVTTSGAGSASSPTKLQSPFTTWFTADGFFVAQPFQKWLATSIPTIGEADPKNAGTEEPSLTGLSASQLDDLLKSSAQTTGADTKQDAVKKSKRKG